MATRHCAFTLFILAIATLSVSAVTIQQVPGITGNVADFEASGAGVVASDNSIGFWVDFGDLAISVPDSSTPFVYTASAGWTNDMEIGNISVVEIVRGAKGEEGDLSAFGIVPTVTATGISSGASFTALPFEVVSYHMEINGLNEGESVNFSKTGNGGEVKHIPEPVLGLGTLGALMFLAIRGVRPQNKS